VIKEELNRSWPELAKDPGFFGKLFSFAEAKKAAEVRRLIDKLADVLKSGTPRLAERNVPSKVKSVTKTASTSKASAKITASVANPQASLETNANFSDAVEQQTEYEELVTYRLTVADIVRLLGQIREAAGISYVIIFIDEFSALSTDLQRRFTTLLKRFIGNHQGIFVKICAITDNYTLGTSIILQRDLFELPLDLDAFVERSSSLGAAMTSLAEATREIVQQRLRAYLNINPDDLFEDTGTAWIELSRAAMGVPRTLRIVLKHAWARAANAKRSKISRSDIDYGIRAASKAYFKQLEGATRDLTTPLIFRWPRKYRQRLGVRRASW
jgi:type II secretory pathway predicted ATPase ExeA